MVLCKASFWKLPFDLRGAEHLGMKWQEFVWSWPPRW
jgi:hypothetical protein